MMIKLNAIKKSYSYRRKKQVVLDNVSMEIEKGDIITIGGSNGSGKTTLLNILGGIDVADEGEYYYNGNRILNKPSELLSFRREHIGIVPQKNMLVDKISVYKNIALPLEIRKESSVKEKVKDISRVLGIEGLLWKKPHKLSVGECQRVSIARAIITNPELLLADEPTSSLDQSSTDTVLGLFQKLRDGGSTVIIITHDEEVAVCGNKRYVMKNGKLTQIATKI